MSFAAPRLRLRALDGRFAVARLSGAGPARVELPAAGSFAALVRRRAELCVVCEEAVVPAGVPVEKGFRALEIEGPLDFAATGILASVATPLAAAGIPLLALSTFDTDVILVRDSLLETAVAALAGAGHEVST